MTFDGIPSASNIAGSRPSIAITRSVRPAEITVSGGWSTAGASADAVDTRSAAAPANASAPPPSASRHDRGDTGGRWAAGPLDAASTASVAMRTACPSSRLIATATNRANAVQIGALQPNPALALRHQSVRYSETADRDDQARRGGDASRLRGEPRVARADECGRREADDQGSRGDGDEEQRREIQRKNGGVAHAADEAGQPRAEPDRRRRAEQQTAEEPDTDARPRAPARPVRACRAPPRGRSGPRRRRGSRASGVVGGARRRRRRQARGWGSRSRFQVPGSRFGFTVRGSGSWFQVRVPGSGSRFAVRVPGSGFRVPGSGSRFQVPGSTWFMVQAWRAATKDESWRR